MNIRSMPQSQQATAISATMAVAKMAELQLAMISPLLPAGMDTVLAAAGGNLLLVPSLVASGGDLESVTSLVGLTRTDAIVVRPAVRSVVVDLVKHGDPIQWISGCRIWTEGEGTQTYLVHEHGDGPAYILSDTGIAMLPDQPWQDREDFIAGLVTATTSFRAIMEAQ